MEHRTDMGLAHVKILQGSSDNCGEALGICYFTATTVGQDGAVGVATFYRLNSLGIESRWGGSHFLYPRPDRT